MHIFQKLSHFIIRYQKITFINITTNLIRKDWSIAELPSSWWQIRVFQNSNFRLKTQILSLVANTVSCFPEELSSLIIPNNNDSLSVVLSSKNTDLCKRWLIQLTITQVPFLETFLGRQQMYHLYIPPILSQRILNRRAQELRFNKCTYCH